MTRIASLRVRARRHVTHTALLYSSSDEYIDGVRRFTSDAVTTGSPVIIAVPRHGLRRLEQGLNGDLSRFQLTDMTELGANPARILPAIKAAIDVHAGQTVYFVGEPVWAGRSEDEIAEAMLHEALLDRAFASAHLHVLCPYDVTAVHAPIIADAERTHRWLCEGGGRRASRAYRAGELPARAHAPLSDPPGHSVSLGFGAADLANVRTLVSERAAKAGLTVGQCGEVVLAVNEIATNSVRHGGGRGTLHTWHERGRLTCQVSDAGRIRDPLAGRVRPEANAPGGRGLWLVNQLCDLVQIRTGRTGTTVRIHVNRRSPHSLHPGMPSL